MAAPQKKKGTKKRSFHQELVLNRWMFRFFMGGSLASLKARLGADRLEGLAEDGQTHYFHELTRTLIEVDKIPHATLRRYDLNIVAHWQRITQQRNKQEGHVLYMKYFQYLSLLFTEIYLDWYFNHKQEMLDGLNEELAQYKKEEGSENFSPFEADDLNKIAFWNATGSGKTLLLHVNILQYLHYFQAGNSNIWPSKIILLTPNEGLSRQHVQEMQLSGFSGRLFDKNNTLPTPSTIEVIDINKLGDEMGDKTVAVEAFEGNNLVLVDEGHRGSSTTAGAWLSRREALVRGGFAFEYSATFGQAVAKGLTVQAAEEEALKKRAKMLFETASLKKLTEAQKAQLVLTAEEQRKARIGATKEIYAKCILFDYSYKFFYEDGYGKDSLILNMAGKAYESEDNAKKYFTACLLAFYQQLWLWDTHGERLRDINVEKPLWVFVGNTVSAEDSDIMEVVNFFAYFLNNDALITTWLADLVADKAHILDAKGNNIFLGRFTPLMGFMEKPEALYADILRRVFNAPARQRLKLVNIKNSKGELALRVGGADPFGLISIGDDSGFFKLADEQTDFDQEQDEFSEAQFHSINTTTSKTNVLIGSRKFTEGWSSWRVATMGLLNMGSSEGSQIIQLFGRGVRLKGKGFSLKRTLEHERPKGTHVDKLETLNVFGVRAGYMAAFKDYLKEEGITPSDEILELDFHTQPNLPAAKLKTLALKDGYKDNQKMGFKRTHFPWLYEVPAEFLGKIKQPHVLLDLYPRVEALGSKGASAHSSNDARHKGKLDPALFSLFDWDSLYLVLQDYKMQRSWSNLRLNKQKLYDFCVASQDWYTLLIPQSELVITVFADVKKQEGILRQLLVDYTERFYKALKNAYEGQFYDITHVTEEHGSMLHLYQFAIDNTDTGKEYLEKLNKLKELVTNGEIGEASTWNAPHMVAISFDRHLYYPLLSLEDKEAVPLKMRPLAFDAPSEWEFVKALEAFYASAHGKACLKGYSLYLLRNAASEEKGLGFALAGNFYPDFLLWLVDDATGKQWLNFVDPKGLRQLDLSDPKLGLYQEIKVLEAKLHAEAKPGDAPLVLNAFILTPTEHKNLLNLASTTTKAELENRHVLFMEDGDTVYLQKMFAKILE